MKCEKLNEKIDDLVDNFKGNAKPIVNECNKKILYFNEQISLINGIRHDDIGPLIRQLHNFLSRFGFLEENLSPFDYVIEIPRLVTEIPDKIEDLSDGYKEKIDNTIGKYEDKKNEKLDYLFKGPIRAGIEDLKNKSKIKENVIEIEKDLGELELEIATQLGRLKQEYKVADEALQVAEIYRVCVFSVIESIKNFILPELEAVITFLLAESLKNIIIAKGDISQLKPESITILPKTIYHKHYMFVQNTFLYYIIITKFFELPILTNFLSDNVITEDERALFDKQVNAIKEQSENVKETLIFTEV